MIQVFPDYERLSAAAAEAIRAAARAGFIERGRFDLVLSGGTTPRRGYELLAPALRVDVRLRLAVRFYWADERCVPPGDPASNYRLAKETLLDAAQVPGRNVFRIMGEAPDLDAECRRYESVFPAAPDLVILGMGADGHTASLFPRAEALHEASRRFAAVAAPVEPARRITITPAGLAAARRIFVLVSGADKAAAFARAQSDDGSPDRTPARLLRDAHWFVDSAAANTAGGP